MRVRSHSAIAKPILNKGRLVLLPALFERLQFVGPILPTDLRLIIGSGKKGDLQLGGLGKPRRVDAGDLVSKQGSSKGKSR